MEQVTTRSIIRESLDFFNGDDLLLDTDLNNGSASATPETFLLGGLVPFCTSGSGPVNGAHNNIVNATSSGFTIQELKYLTYGIIWPSICAAGIVGNVLNLIVLNQPNMKGTAGQARPAYIYMRGE